jgi:hypothetical protein
MMVTMMNCTTMQEQIVAMLGDQNHHHHHHHNHHNHHNQQFDFCSNTKSPTTASASASASASLQQPMLLEDPAIHKPPTAITTTTMAQVEALLDQLVDATHAQLHQEKQLDQCIHEHIQRATARQAMGSQLGVILCMNQVHMLQMQRQGVSAAVQLLESYIAKLEAQLDECLSSSSSSSSSTLAHAAAAAGDDDDDTTSCTFQQDMLLHMDISEPRDFAQHVQRILFSSSSSSSCRCCPFFP